jgi:hypothetical protein
MQLLSKLNSIERKVKNIPAVADSDIRAWVRAGVTYDKLTDEQRTRYNQYWEIDFIDFYNFIGAPLDFELELKPPPPKNKEEEQARIRKAADEIETIMEEMSNEPDGRKEIYVKAN